MSTEMSGWTSTAPTITGTSVSLLRSSLQCAFAHTIRWDCVMLKSSAMVSNRVIQ